MNLLDRQLIISYVKSYLGCVVSLLGLYVVVDLFMNIDDFAQGKDGLVPVLAHIGAYYGMNIWQYFDRMCEAIILLAAMFTVAQTQRNNELLPLLSAGVSTRELGAVPGCSVVEEEKRRIPAPTSSRRQRAMPAQIIGSQ